MSSEHDVAVLNAIFNPLSPSEDEHREDLIHLKDHDDDNGDNEKIASIKALEKDGVEAAEKGCFDEALSIFTKAIEASPTRPSGYNNRAQVHRFKGAMKDALMDLDKAIELSNGHGRSACQAFCQRGLIFLREGDTDRAKQDFQAAADLGSKFAKSQLVNLNPYAALCNQMLQSVFNNLYS